MVYYAVKAYVDILDNKARDGLELFVQMKMEQNAAYKKECRHLFEDVAKLAIGR
ncbi:hypothetical protein HCEG_03304 [Histoplasma capsulatum var. duboisii H88]|uniref:Uncharacterized protein n=1 Tax=Ajellomyces capsulatus (strain H88) TaxID=544711 RepID=F0UF77_AJEC8|nr:hypothetical protein HCEG_03304 [Histoplasma capsulatum var. duboisii H88]